MDPGVVIPPHPIAVTFKRLPVAFFHPKKIAIKIAGGIQLFWRRTNIYMMYTTYVQHYFSPISGSGPSVAHQKT
jgi:hypothetical protein